MTAVGRQEDTLVAIGATGENYGGIFTAAAKCTCLREQIKA